MTGAVDWDDVPASDVAATREREQAIAALSRARAVEKTMKMAQLAYVLEEEVERFAQHDLYVATGTGILREPEICILTLDRSKWGSVEWWEPEFRLRAVRRDLLDAKKLETLMDRQLTGDVELARDILIELVERGLLRLSDFGSLPRDLRPLVARRARTLTIEHAAIVPVASPSGELVRMERASVSDPPASRPWWRRR